jgi:hypothetical protein
MPYCSPYIQPNNLLPTFTLPGNFQLQPHPLLGSGSGMECQGGRNELGHRSCSSKHTWLEPGTLAQGGPSRSSGPGVSENGAVGQPGFTRDFAFLCLSPQLQSRLLVSTMEGQGDTVS